MVYLVNVDNGGLVACVLLGDPNGIQVFANLPPDSQPSKNSTTRDHERLG